MVTPKLLYFFSFDWITVNGFLFFFFSIVTAMDQNPFNSSTTAWLQGTFSSFELLILNLFYMPDLFLNEAKSIDLLPMVYFGIVLFFCPFILKIFFNWGTLQ